MPTGSQTGNEAGRCRQQPVLSFWCGLVTLQSALGFFGDSTAEPSFAEESVEVVLAEDLAVLDAAQVLYLTRLAGLLAESQDSHCDLSGDLSGRLAFSLCGLSDETRMEGQAHQEKCSAFVGFEDRRRRAILLHGLQHLWDAWAAAFREAQLFMKLVEPGRPGSEWKCLD